MPRFSFYLPIISHGSRKKKCVALTFDDGPDPKITSDILKILAKHSIKAAFFITGERASQYPEIVKKIAAQGHDIGNHSYHHNTLLMLGNKKYIYSEIKSAQDELAKSGFYPYAFRPPAGITNPGLGNILLELGMYCVNFSCRAFDAGNRRIDNLAKRITKKVRPGDIILLHDIAPHDHFDKKNFLNEIKKLIKTIKGMHIDIVPLQDLTGKKVMDIKNSISVSNPARNFYNQIAERYDYEQFNSAVSWSRKKEYNFVMSRLPGMISKTDKILEIGAGTGIFTIPLAELCDEITAVDISANMLDICAGKARQRGLPNIIIKNGDIETIQIKNKYNLICSFSSFEYIKDLPALIKKISDMLEPGGILYFTTAHKSLFRYPTQIGNYMRQGTWLKARNKKEVSNILLKNNLKNISIATIILKSILTEGILMEVLARRHNEKE